MHRRIDTAGSARTDGNRALDLVDNFIRMSRNGRAGSEFKALQLSSAFQPIFSIAHRRAVGYEALLRARDDRGNPVSPLQVFAMADAGPELTRLDRLCRTLHVHNFQTMTADSHWLFLNVNPEVVVHGKNYGAFFAEMLDHYAFPAHRIVVEILEDTIRDESLLTEAVEYYRRLGCLVLREGVETQEEALVSMDADVDFVQGYYFGKPAAGLETAPDNACSLAVLCDRFKSMVAAEARSHRDSTGAYIAGFLRCAEALRAGAPLANARAGFLAKAGIERRYLLSVDGAQIGANQTSPLRPAKNDRRFAVLEDVNDARWFRRTYFRRALVQPGQVQMSRPYLSLTGAHRCVTLSIALEIDGETRVFCRDLNWETMAG